ncbi:MAG: hypothetical protein HC917_21400 [Richelia sp. SM2_1_7]|nr:hypothetical protein [Richelia sp. SM2_1_7]
MSARIGIPVTFESDINKKYKGKLKNGVAVINLAYATLDTPIHEILGHAIIRAIKNKKSDTNEVTLLYDNLLKELEYGKGKEVLDRIKKDYDVKSINNGKGHLVGEGFKAGDFMYGKILKLHRKLMIN